MGIHHGERFIGYSANDKCNYKVSKKFKYIDSNSKVNMHQ